MSLRNAQDWLLSQNKFDFSQDKIASNLFCSPKKLNRKAYTISVTSGKGGVGKTSISVKTGKLLAEAGYKVLVFDCDYNLSNTVIKLGLPINNDFYQLTRNEKTFDECVHKSGNFHLLSACNGDLDLFEDEIRLDKFVINLLVENENKYDFIILDCPAGMTKETLTLNAYSDYRFFVVTPDKASITDSYSLMKVLSKKYGVRENHLLVNKVSSIKQYKRMVKIMSETVENYLSCRLRILGGIRMENRAVDIFDKVLFDPSSRLHGNFVKVLNRFSEESVDLCDTHFMGETKGQHYASVDDFEQDVRQQASQGVGNVISL
ncbi:MAG: AAA family ATPase [Bacteriovoracaceae bacterium]|nr:AAA family ATPase [Bacteriovoracaceae bacterium]